MAGTILALSFVPGRAYVRRTPSACSVADHVPDPNALDNERMHENKLVDRTCACDFFLTNMYSTIEMSKGASDPSSRPTLETRLAKVKLSSVVLSRAACGGSRAPTAQEFPYQRSPIAVFMVLPLHISLLDGA